MDDYIEGIFSIANIKAGEAFTVTNIRSIRPDGVALKALPQLLGKKAARNIAQGEPVGFHMISADEQWIVRI